MNFHSLVVDDSTHGLIDRHRLDSGNLGCFDQDRVLKQQ